MQYTFDDIAGYEREKAELKRLCGIFNDRRRYEAMGARMPKGIVFYGEAGTGKTLFAKVLASECKLRSFVIDAGVADGDDAICGAIRRAFSEAAACGGPAMIFFDEVDKLLPSVDDRYMTDRARTVLAQLLTLLDGMDSVPGIVFVATCNSYRALPGTLTRPGRIDKKIGIGLPGLSSRTAILRMYAGKTACTFGMSMEEIARATAGFSCAALETLINECVLQSDERGFAGRELVQTRLFEIESEDIPRASSSEDDAVRACRNLGSFVVARAFDSGGYLLTLERDTVCNDFFNGILSDYDADYTSAGEDDEDGDGDPDDLEDPDGYDGYDDDGEDEKASARLYCREDLLHAVTVRLGGYAAEELVLHTLYDNVAPDLSLADDVLVGMAEQGMFGLGLLPPGRRREVFGDHSARAERCMNFLDERLAQCLAEARELVAAGERLIRALMPVLIERRVLGREDCEKLIASLDGMGE